MEKLLDVISVCLGKAVSGRLVKAGIIFLPLAVWSLCYTFWNLNERWANRTQKWHEKLPRLCYTVHVSVHSHKMSIRMCGSPPGQGEPHGCLSSLTRSLTIPEGTEMFSCAGSSLFTWHLTPGTLFWSSDASGYCKNVKMFDPKHCSCLFGDTCLKMDSVKNIPQKP